MLREGGGLERDKTICNFYGGPKEFLKAGFFSITKLEGVSDRFLKI